MFPSMGHRAWFAWHCLKRDDRLQPPAWRELERANGLTNGSLYKLIWGKATRPSYDRLVRMARALGCTPEWLINENGPGPVASLPVPPRPAEPAKESAKEPSKKDRSPVSETLGELGFSEGISLHVGERGAKQVPRRVRAELPNKRKASTRNNSSK